MATKIPAFSFSGSYDKELKNGYWVIYLKSSGTIRFAYQKNIEVCVVGGGATGSKHDNFYWGHGFNGGGGGEVKNLSTTAMAGADYDIVIGAGGVFTTGARNAPGNTSSAFGATASGGVVDVGGAGGTHGADGGTGAAGMLAFGDSAFGYYGGYGGGGGSGSKAGVIDGYNPGSGGAGGEGGGGRGGDGNEFDNTVPTAAVAGAANTGAGGGGEGGDYIDHGSRGGSAAEGGSGIVIIRGTQDDILPIRFNGILLTEIFFNGEAVTSLIYGGKTIFAEVMRCLASWAERFGSRAATLG